jgi:hypothetical protein
LNTVDPEILGPPRALAMARTEVTRCRVAHMADPTPETLNAWTDALRRWHVVKAQVREASELARRCEGDEEAGALMDLTERDDRFAQR